MQRFTPHSFNTRVSRLGSPPLVLIAPEALKMMWLLTEMVDDEVGWLGTCDYNGQQFYIREIFVPKQLVGPVNTTLTPQGLADMTMDLINEREDATEIINTIRFWGHSHVRMETSPSRQDMEQMEAFMGNGVEFFLRAIVNKHGKMEFTAYLPEEGLIIYDLPWDVDDPSESDLRRRVASMIEEKVRKPAPPKPLVTSKFPRRRRLTAVSPPVSVTGANGSGHISIVTPSSDLAAVQIERSGGVVVDMPDEGGEEGQS